MKAHRQALLLFLLFPFVVCYGQISYIDSINNSRRQANVSINKMSLADTILIDSAPNTVLSIEDAMKATVSVKGNGGHGSGFFISRNLIVTNYHVIQDENGLFGIASDGTRINLTVLRFNEDRDLALLTTDSASTKYFTINPKAVDSTIIGRDIFVIGSPLSLDLSNSISFGMISGVRMFDQTQFIQLDARVNPGNSGGPIIDKNNTLIGVITAKAVGYAIEGLGFAIPNNEILSTLKIRYK